MQIGWNMAIETTNGIVGLWTCWLGNSFKLFYPLDVNIPDEVIMETLNVTLAKPIANELFGTRLWAKYYSEKLDGLGRVWIEQESNHSNGYQLETIRNKHLEKHYCGHSHTNTIWTYDFNFCSEAEPEAPNCEEKNIQAYKDKFVELLVKVAKLVGDITAINLDSGLVLYTPTMLVEKGYSLAHQKEGYYIQNDDFEIMLVSCNSIVPWRTVIRYPSSNELTAKNLLDLVNSFDNSEKPFDPVPIITYFAERERIYDLC